MRSSYYRIVACAFVTVIFLAKSLAAIEPDQKSSHRYDRISFPLMPQTHSENKVTISHSIEPGIVLHSTYELSSDVIHTMKSPWKGNGANELREGIKYETGDGMIHFTFDDTAQFYARSAHGTATSPITNNGVPNVTHLLDNSVIRSVVEKVTRETQEKLDEIDGESSIVGNLVQIPIIESKIKVMRKMFLSLSYVLDKHHKERNIVGTGKGRFNRFEISDQAPFSQVSQAEYNILDPFVGQFEELQNELDELTGDS